MLCLIINRNEVYYPFSIDQVISNKNVSLIFQYSFQDVYCLPQGIQSLLTWKIFVVNEILVCNQLNVLQILSVFRLSVLKRKEQLLARLIIFQASSIASSISSGLSSSLSVFPSVKYREFKFTKECHLHLSIGSRLNRYPWSVPYSTYMTLLDTYQFCPISWTTFHIDL